MEPVGCPSLGGHVVNGDHRSYIPLEEHTQILTNLLALLTLLSGMIEAQKTLNPLDDRRYVLREEHILILMNSMGLLLRLHLSGRNIDLPTEAENRWTQMLNKYCNFRSFDELYAVLSDLLTKECERRGRGGSHSRDEGSSSYSDEVTGQINNLALKNKVGCLGMTASTSVLLSKSPEVINDSSVGINSPPDPHVSIDIPSVVYQVYEEVDEDHHGRIREIPTYRINSTPEPYLSIDVPSVVDQQQRKEHEGGEPANTKKRDNSIISQTTLAIAAQAAGGLVSRAFSGSAHSSWISNFAAVATVFGISFPLLGNGLRHVKPKLSATMEKLGAVAMTSAIILALGLTAVPAVAWTAGTMACLLTAIGVAMA